MRLSVQKLAGIFMVTGVLSLVTAFLKGILPVHLAGLINIFFFALGGLSILVGVGLFLRIRKAFHAGLLIAGLHTAIGAGSLVLACRAHTLGVGSAFSGLTILLSLF